MNPNFSGLYQGELRTQATHLYSGTQIFTDAPLDNQGKAESFSPTDLLCVSLAACAATTMGIKAQSMGVSIEGMSWQIQKIMASSPRRVEKVIIHFELKNSTLSEKDKQILIQTGLNCPVARSLSADLVQEMVFNI
jgi:uncharacterized OsmC-like protein